MQLIYIILTALGSLAIFFILLGLVMRFRAFALKGTIVPSLAGYAGRILQHSTSALVYFYSPDCLTCGDMTQTIERLAVRNGNVLSIDVSVDKDIAKKFKIMATPTLVSIRNGRIHKILMGPQPPAIVEAQLS